MARPREFDKDEVIEKAMLLFWEKGYEATPVRDLNKVMGISSSSMYEVFGDKRGVYMLALARFCELERARIRHMANEAATPQAFIQLLFGSVESVSLPASLQGSMAFNAMVEFGTRDHEVTPLLLAHYLGIADIIADVVAAGQRNGTIASRTPAPDLAYTFLTTLHGVATLKGVKPDFAFVPAIMQVLFQLLAPD